MNHGSSSRKCGLLSFEGRHNGHAGLEGLAELPAWTHGHRWKATKSFLFFFLPNEQVRWEINRFFHTFFTHLADRNYIHPNTGRPAPTLHFYLPLTILDTYTLRHTLPRAMWMSIHSAEASCTPGDSRGRWCWLRSRCVREKQGRVGRLGPQACPSSSAQPAHSCSYSGRPERRNVPDVRLYCPTGGLPDGLKRPFRGQIRMKTWAAVISQPQTYGLAPINLSICKRKKVTYCVFLSIFVAETHVSNCCNVALYPKGFLAFR